MHQQGWLSADLLRELREGLPLPAGEAVAHGTSLAVHDDAGNLADITGFFPTD